MAQAQPEAEKFQKTPEIMERKDGATTSVSFKFNALAPEFVPRSHAQVPFQSYYYPFFHYLGGSCESDWFLVGDQDPSYFLCGPSVSLPSCSKNVLSDDLQQKIIRQVEYQFSDMSLLGNECFMKQISKDPEGYVPISFIASTKRMKSLITNNQLLTQTLRSSSELVLSEDGKRVRRKYPFSEKDKEELQSRTVVAENLPEDHSHQNLERIFSTVGSVKNIRMCYPQESNSSRSKSECLISNKSHALVEYESTEIAERAAEKLNDERNWRKGLRVRLLLRRSPKSVLKSRRLDFDGFLDDDDSSPSESIEDFSQQSNQELITESNAEENSAGLKKGWSRGRGKTRPQGQNHSGRGSVTSSHQLTSRVYPELPAKQSSKGPRMPDGTRGFTMGRGKPINPPSSTGWPC